MLISELKGNSGCKIYLFYNLYSTFLKKIYLLYFLLSLRCPFCVIEQKIPQSFLTLKVSQFFGLPLESFAEKMMGLFIFLALKFSEQYLVLQINLLLE
jgi:hypothetical protein